MPRSRWPITRPGSYPSSSERERNRFASDLASSICPRQFAKVNLPKINGKAIGVRPLRRQSSSPRSQQAESSSDVAPRVIVIEPIRPPCRAISSSRRKLSSAILSRSPSPLRK